ncbi:MAG TPA: family 10 glycosylhydrolase [Clostridia bacterium]|nr:family 10 glycosylhydrolase [Clostridia bacterium]
MRYLKSTFLCICFFTIFLFQLNVSAADNPIPAPDGPAITVEDGSVYPIDLLDKEREEGKIIVYTRSYGEFTKPFTADTHEYVVVNNIVVHKSTSGTTGTYIPPDGCVISYTGADPGFIEDLCIGRMLTLSNISMPEIPDMYFTLDEMLVPIDRINAGRDANQTVLYTPAFGASTKTNVWGMELTVVDNVIVKLADIPKDNTAQPENNSEIPPEGAVISIHVGSPYYKQLQEKAKIGSSIRISADARLYNASKIKYAAYNPRTIADNPAAWDKYEGKPYDGFRGPDQLIIYDSSYGERTGTNPYGYEVAVNSEGKIISTGGNDSEIPEAGYILSGHGKSLKWLEQYALLGATVLLDSDKKEATMILTPDSYVNRAAFSIEYAQDRLEKARQQYLDVPYEKVQAAIDIAASKLGSVQAEVSLGQYDGLTGEVAEIQKDADNAYFMTFESFKTENRAVWLRPRDTSIAQIQKRLDMLKELNINILYLETCWNGYAIYPTGSEIMQQNPMFKGIDILGAYLKEAHARGIEVHAWVENFLVGMPVAEKKPEWMAVSRKGDMYYLENGVTKYYFMNPALPEVRDFLSGLYTKLVKKYNLDGIQFDYMRYSHSGDYSNDYGYDEYTRQLFRNYAGADPIALKPGDTFWEKWCEFRTHLISSYAYRIISEVKSLKPEIRISADVWPEYDKTLADIYQDPKSWTRKDYINSLIPMSYYLHEGPVADDIMNSIMFARGHSQLTSGIASFNKVDTKVFIRQVDVIRNANTNGIAIFEYESLLNGAYSDALRLGTFSTPAAVTNRDTGLAVKAVLDEIARKIGDVYVRYKGMSSVQGEEYKKLLEGIKVNLADSMNNASAAYAARDNIEKMLIALSSDEDLNGEVAARIATDLNRAINIIDGYISDVRFITAHKVKKLQLEVSYRALPGNGTVPYRIKAVFDDNTAMYLDSTQYTISSGNPSAVEIAGNMLKLKDAKGRAMLTINVLDSFKFNTVKGLSRKAVFLMSYDGSTISDPASNLLKITEAGYTTVGLNWGSMVTNADIAGYIVYRDGAELARISSDDYIDRELQPGETYTYYIQGFDISGNMIYESSRIKVNTKTPPLIASQQ